MTRARRARRACVAVGGSRRRSRAGPFARAAVVFFSCSSPVRSPVVVLVLVSRLLYGRCSVRSEGAARGGRRVTRARRARRACVAVGGTRRRSRAGPFARAAVVSSSLALLPSGRRSSSSSSRAFSTAAAPCGARARGATGDARATRAARVRRRGWFSPPQSSRAVRARRGGLLLLLFSRPVAGRRPRLAPSLRPPLRAERGRGGRRVTRARRARRACVAVGGSRRRSRAGPFARAAVVFFSCSSPVRSPSSSSSSSRAFSTAAAPCGARARRAGATGDARATRAARVRRRGWFSPPQSSRAVRARRGGLLLLLFSRPVAGRRPRPRLAPSLRPPLRAERGRGRGGDG